MQEDDALYGQGLRASEAVSAHLRAGLSAFLSPLLESVDAVVDARLVRTLQRTVESILIFRNRAHGLLLSELGGYLMPPHQAPAGTKRLSNLLRSRKWGYALIENFLWENARKRHEEIAESGDDPLLVWDDSVIEKPESIEAEGLCSVRSSKAGRLTHVKRGFYTPPTKPIFVPGLRWTCLLLLAKSGPPTLARMLWWTRRGKKATSHEEIQTELLAQCVKAFGATVLHIFDRGYTSRHWILAVLSSRCRFVLRFPKRNHLVDGRGKRPAWQITRGKKAWDERYLRDMHSKNLRHVKVLAVRVHHSNLVPPLWLVVARQGKGKEPWYLLTSERVETKEDCWRIVFAYVRRWQIETCFRYNKSELAMESPRLWTWERRMKLLLIVTLVYAFLLGLLKDRLQPLREWLLRHYCHRTGKRGRETSAPLYRLRSAIARLFDASPYSTTLENSG